MANSILIFCTVLAASNPTVNAFPMTSSEPRAFDQQSSAIDDIVAALTVS